jgi:hypothetical protein
MKNKQVVIRTTQSNILNLSDLIFRIKLTFSNSIAIDLIISEALASSTFLR